MAIPKPLRLVALVAFTLIICIIFLIRQTPTTPITLPPDAATRVTDSGKMEHDPLSDPYIEPAEPLHRVSGNNYAPDNPNSDRVNATLLTLCRNSELDDILMSMRDLERTFNRKFNYPWLFLNDEPFTAEFKKKVSAATKAQVTFDVVPKEHWAVPEWINEDLYQESVHVLKSQGVQYMDKKSYHQMCRWNSGFFYKHPALINTKWYWRVEPHVHFFCDIDYDVFRWMETHNKTYGFTVNLFDSPESISGLWPETIKFISDPAHNQYQHPNNAVKWLRDGTHRPENFKKANGYSTCHFWSNFEIGNMEFWRSPAYEEYFNHLDRAGGFFYERWGDAPVHSIALGLFEDKSKIHWFRDIGYQHIPFFNCPNSPKCHGCTPGKFTDGEEWLHRDDCRAVWFKVAGMD